MKTRKKAWILAGVLGVVAAVIGSQSELYTRVAYTHHEWSSEPPPHLVACSVRYYSKRKQWLPGPDYFVPSQPCGWCRQSRHGDCPSLRYPMGEFQLDKALGWLWVGQGQLVRMKPVRYVSVPEWLCTCDCSHMQSEYDKAMEKFERDLEAYLSDGDE